MGSRFQTAVIDLDGTLMRCNTFTEFVKFMFRKCGGCRFRIAWIVALRKMRLVSHHEAKARLMRIASMHLSAGYVSDFAESLTPFVNESVVEITQGIPRRILATAAPELYVKEIAGRMGIPEYCATKPGYPENKGEMKLRNVLAMGVIFGPGTLVITDHKDDTPLLEANSGGKNILLE